MLGEVELDLLAPLDAAARREVEALIGAIDLPKVSRAVAES